MPAEPAPWRAYVTGLGVSVLAALGVVLAGIDTQSALVPDAEGRGWAFSQLFGPDAQSLRRQGWTVLTTGGLPDEASFSRLLDAHLLADFCFIAVYALLLVGLVRALGVERTWRVPALVLVGLLAAADLVENITALGVVRGGTGLSALLGLTTAKWVLAAVLAALLVLRLLVPRRSSESSTAAVARFRRGLREAVTAVVHQRFSYLPVLVILVLSVASGAPILEQLPDAQRGWLFDPEAGRRHAVASVAGTAMLALFLLAVGRERTVYARRHPAGPDPGAPPPVPGRQPTRGRFAVWLVGPALALAGVVLYAAVGRADLILWRRTAVWVALPLVIVVASSVLRFLWWYQPRWRRPYRPPTFTPDQQVAVGIAGTVAGVGVVVIGGLALLRSLTPLVVLPAEAYTDPTTPTGWRTGLVALLVVAVSAVAGPWLVLLGYLARHGGPGRPVLREQDGLLARLADATRRLLRARGLRGVFRYRAWLLLAAAVAVFLGLGLSPSLAAALGLAATATLALGSLAGILAGTGLVLQDLPSAEVFRLLRLRRTPLVSLLVLTVVGVTAFGSADSLHAVDRGTRAAVEPRPSLDGAFRALVEAPTRCPVTVDGYPVVPMLMVAAQGGGIRAAYWTVGSLAAIGDQTCAASSTLFSGGASGGSVGLTVARFSGNAADPGSEAAVRAVERLSRPEALSETADGAFVRDLAYGATGVPLPRPGEPDPYAWLDRARLLERGWSGTGDWGRRRFLDQQDVSPATGALVLNSTSVRGPCRVWLSQLRLPAPSESLPPSYDPELGCDAVRGVAPRTVDLFAAYGPLNPAGTSRCLDSVSTATAALLTARFPYVTPSGVVCSRSRGDRPLPARPYWPRTQLVDGGYVENTGLATVTDLAHLWLPLVRRQNEAALADPGRSTPLVVPIVVYLANGDREAPAARLGASLVSELAVPPLTYLAARDALTSEQAQLARASSSVALAGFCPTAEPTCDTLGRSFPSRVVVVDRSTQPEVAAPLGWVLSKASTDSLRSDLAAQRRTLCPANRPGGPAAPAAEPVTPRTRATCRPGYATLGDLRRYLGR